MLAAISEGLRRTLEDSKKMIVLMERIESLAFPDEDRQRIRLAAVIKSDIAFDRQCRQDHNHLVSTAHTRCLRRGANPGDAERPHPLASGLPVTQFAL